MDNVVENNKNNTFDYIEIFNRIGYGVWRIIFNNGKKPQMFLSDKTKELMGYDFCNMTPQEIYIFWRKRVVGGDDIILAESLQKMIGGEMIENLYEWEHPEKGRIYVRTGASARVQPDGSLEVSGFYADVNEIVGAERQKYSEIKALNALLEENQEKLKKSAEEQKAQFQEIMKLNKELEEHRIGLEKKNEILRRNYDVISSLSKRYFCIYHIDVATGKFVEINTALIQGIEGVIGMRGDAQKGFVAMSEHLVTPEFKQTILDFCNLKTITERLRDKDSVSVEFYGVHAGWSEGTFIAAHRDEKGNCTHILWAIRSIHQIKEEDEMRNRELAEAKEKAEAASAAKTSFLFNMSHDIRTPMNAIMGFRDLLEKHQDDPDKRADYLRKIEDASSVLLSIINNVLEMARIEKGTIEIDETTWSADQFYDTVYSIFCDMMQKKGLEYTRGINVKHNYVYCDPIKLREIFINILSNAYKYTPEGSVHMQLDEIPYDREGWVLYRTTITDTGIGMSEEFIPHLFEEFSREQNTTDAKIEGTGLGMPIVKRLVEILGGTIEVKSQKGVGSQFIVTIPHRISEKESLVVHAGVEVDPKLFEGKRILLAEDNELNAEIAIEILSEAGFVVEHAEDGQECVNMLSDAPAKYYDIILMDIQMPKMNGYEASKTIRAMVDPEKAGIPILAMTANAFEEDKREAIRSGMNGHLAKPINVSSLMKEIAALLS